MTQDKRRAAALHELFHEVILVGEGDVRRGILRITIQNPHVGKFLTLLLMGVK